MKKFKSFKVAVLLFSVIMFFGCKSETENQDIEPEVHNIIENNEAKIEQNKSAIEETISEPESCVDWIGFYGEETRALEKQLNKNLVKVKTEGNDKYNSSDKLVGNYILKDKNMPIAKIESLAKYLAYNLCLSDNKKFNGVLMNCESRKIQVAIARTNEKYSAEAWAVVYNIFPANKKGELNTMDY